MKLVLHGTFGSGESGLYVWVLNGCSCFALPWLKRAKSAVYRQRVFISMTGDHYSFAGDSLIFLLGIFFVKQAKQLPSLFYFRTVNGCFLSIND
ncbi:hypothetical protein BH10BAC4_BH10BAC4_12350 [soil metagenome]